MVAAPTLAFYDLNKPTTVSADASSYVLEAVLLQEDTKTKRPADEKRMPSIWERDTWDDYNNLTYKHTTRL